MPETTSGFAEMDGGRIYYEIRGEGEPMVLSHAAFVDSGMWDAQVDEFARHYRVIRYDIRGFGRSEPASGPVSIRDDLYGLLEHLGVERAVLVGCSMSATAVLDMAIERPELVSALVVINGLPSGYEEEGEWVMPPIVQEMEAAAERGDLDAVSELQIRLWVDGASRTPDQVDPDVRRRAAEMNRPTVEHEVAFGDDLEPPAFVRLGEVRCPTLIVTGDLDEPVVGRAAEAMAKGIPGATHVVIGGTAHVPNMEKPREFNGAVLGFLRG